MDRYQSIQAVEDLGGIEMWPDRTEDLRATTRTDRDLAKWQENDPAPAATGDEVDVHPLHIKGMRTAP